MARFRHKPISEEVTEIPLSADGRRAFFNESRTVSAAFNGTEVSLEIHGQTRTYTIQHAVFSAPNGVRILPYFVRDGQVRVVMVEQFRIALSQVTLEPVGGAADDHDAQTAMARELEEEARIKVDPSRVNIVYEEYIQPSLMRSRAYGGLVKIEPSELSAEIMGGEHQFGEYTAVRALPFVSLLKDRDSGRLLVDLETSRLFDALALELGLIIKCY